MTPEQIAEGQRRSAAFIAEPESSGAVGTPSRSQTGTGSLQHEAPPKGFGTGFFIAPDGRLLTAAHLVAKAATVRVRTRQGMLAAEVVRVDTINDVALLKVEGQHEALRVAPSRSVRIGDPVFTVGFPNIAVQGLTPKLTKGDVNSLAGIQDDPRSFQISVAVQPGNSGGPLVDRAGNVIGLVVAGLDDKTTLGLTGALPQNVNYALKSCYILSMLESIPDLARELPGPHTEEERSFEAVVKEAESAVCLVLVY
jgi:S1-C subfamily serine protease